MFDWSFNAEELSTLKHVINASVIFNWNNIIFACQSCLAKVTKTSSDGKLKKKIQNCQSIKMLALYQNISDSYTFLTFSTSLHVSSSHNYQIPFWSFLLCFQQLNKQSIPCGNHLLHRFFFFASILYHLSPAVIHRFLLNYSWSIKSLPVFKTQEC